MNAITKIKDYWDGLGMWAGFPMTESCSYSDFPKKVPHLFEIAKKEILISTTLTPEFYDNENVKKSLKEAIDRGVEVKILVDKGGHKISEVKWLEEYCKTKKTNVNVVYSSIEIPHLIVIDEKHVREETPHGKDDINKAENDIIFNAGIIATLNRRILKKWLTEGTDACI